MLIDSKTFNHYTLQCLSRAYNRQLSLSYQKYIDAAATTLSVTQNLNELNNTKKTTESSSAPITYSATKRYFVFTS